MWSDPAFDEKWQQTATERAPAKRNELLKEPGVYAIENSLYVMLPLGGYYSYAWPWVRNYYGENTAGAFNSGGHLCPHMARPGVKKAMGYQGMACPPVEEAVAL